MTYNVFGGTLSLTQSINCHVRGVSVICGHVHAFQSKLTLQRRDVNIADTLSLVFEHSGLSNTALL